MIVALAFGSPRRCGDRAVREARFVPRSTIPASALCVVANGVREHLRRLLGVAAEVTFGDAVPLSASSRSKLVEGAYCFRTPGRSTDVFVFLRRGDARRLLAVAFGEPADDGELSALERSALGRLVNELAALFDPLCAERQAPAQAVAPAQASRCATYVDLRIGPPIDAILGIGLTREPPDDVSGPKLLAEQLLGVRCDVRAEIARGSISAARLTELAPGDVVVMDTKVGGEAVLKVAELVIARGRGGVVVDEDAVSGTAAFAVD